MEPKALLQSLELPQIYTSLNEGQGLAQALSVSEKCCTEALIINRQRIRLEKFIPGPAPRMKTLDLVGTELCWCGSNRGAPVEGCAVVGCTRLHGLGWACSRLSLTLVIISCQIPRITAVMILRALGPWRPPLTP